MRIRRNHHYRIWEIPHKSGRLAETARQKRIFGLEECSQPIVPQENHVLTGSGKRCVFLLQMHQKDVFHFSGWQASGRPKIYRKEEFK